MATATKSGPKQITLRNVRLSYPQLFQAKGFLDTSTGKLTEPKFSASLILDKKLHAKEIAALNVAIDDCAKEFFKGKLPHLKNKALRDGAEKDGKDGYGDAVMFVSASSKRRPQVVDKDPSVPLVEADGKPYAGCYVNACISLWAYDHKLGGKGVSANLLAVQFLKDGEPFGESIKADEVFTNEAGEGDEEADPLG